MSALCRSLAPLQGLIKIRAAFKTAVMPSRAHTRNSVAKRTMTIKRHFCDSKGSRNLEWSYDHGEAPAPLRGVTIGQLMEERASLHPDREAAVFLHQDYRFTFKSLLEESDKLAAGLLELGVRRGDRVGIWAPNCKEWVLAQYATARAGMILVNVNPAYQAPELEYALRKVNVKALIIAEKFKTQDYYAMLKSICPELDNCTPGHLVSHRLPDLTSVIVIGKNTYPGTLSFEEVMNDISTASERDFIKSSQNELQFDDPINIQFTSGTTGSPKGALLSHHNIVNNAFFIGLRMGYDKEEPRICVPVPLYHCFGMVLASLQSMLHGASCVYPSAGFEPASALRAVQTERCTALYGTPTMFIDMLGDFDSSKYDLSSLRTGIMAGSPCPEEIMKQVYDKFHMPEVTICYGTTENSPVTFQTYLHDSLENRVGTIGRASAHMEVKVVDERGDIVRVNTPGELCVRGYSVMRGYFNDADKTQEVIGDDRWYRTGDIAVIRADGYGRIEGRIKDMIVRGGENIYPVEIEQFLYQHPAIEDVQVVGVPDARLGEQVCAWIRLREGSDVNESNIKEFCKGKISHFKIPHYIMFVDEFPLTITGKVKKYVIREEARRRLGLH